MKKIKLWQVEYDVDSWSNSKLVVKANNITEAIKNSLKIKCDWKGNQLKNIVSVEIIAEED